MPVKKTKCNLPGAGPGRPKGVPNKNTALLKDAILEAAHKAGDKDGMVGYLVKQAEKNPVAFMGLLGRVLPLQIVADVTQRTAEVTDEIMTVEEWTAQWDQRHKPTSH
jgi:hypothetical protein